MATIHLVITGHIKKGKNVIPNTAQSVDKNRYSNVKNEDISKQEL